MNRADGILRPTADGWELCPLNAGSNRVADPDTKRLAVHKSLVLGLPAASCLAIPLWIPEGAEEMAELELSSRHLLKKDAAVGTIPVLEKDGRTLSLALAVVDDGIPPEFFEFTRRCEPVAMLFPRRWADVIVWRESEALCFALQRAEGCVFFAFTGELSVDVHFTGLIDRTLARLRSEGVLESAPVKAVLVGSFSDDDRRRLGDALRVECEQVADFPDPVLPERPSRCDPPGAKRAVAKLDRTKKIALGATIALAVYSVLLLLVAADLGWQRYQLHRLGAEIAGQHDEAAAAERLVTDWKAFRTSIDPRLFALDQLAAVASEIPGEQVRLTQYQYDRGRLSIAGEAADVSQAYEFQERVKKSEPLLDYEWTSRQPQLAGKNKVRFEMEGTRPDAATGEE